MSTLRSGYVRFSHLRRVLILVGAAAGVVFAKREVFADQEPIDIDYSVAETCPTMQEFVADVRFRTALARQPHGRDARHFVVNVRREPDGPFLGDLRIVSSEGVPSVPREVSDASCLEVVRTLALVAALAIDPQASTGPSTIGSDQSGPQTPAFGTVPPGALYLPQPAQPTTLARPTPREPGWQSAPERKISSRRVSWHWSAGVQGLAVLDVAPVAVLGGGFFAQVEPDGTWLVWPDFRLTAAYASVTSDWVAGPPASAGARSWWLLGRAEACPGRWGVVPGHLLLRFCGFLDGGTFTNSGVALTNSRTTTKSWFAFGPAIRLTMFLGSRLYADLAPGLMIPITRWRFTYKDSPTSSDQGLERIRRAGETFSVSVGYRFP